MGRFNTISLTSIYNLYNIVMCLNLPPEFNKGSYRRVGICQHTCLLIIIFMYESKVMLNSPAEVKGIGAKNALVIQNTYLETLF